MSLTCSCTHCSANCWSTVPYDQQNHNGLGHSQRRTYPCVQGTILCDRLASQEPYDSWFSIERRTHTFSIPKGPSLYCICTEMRLLLELRTRVCAGLPCPLLPSAYLQRQGASATVKRGDPGRRTYPPPWIQTRTGKDAFELRSKSAGTCTL